MSQPDDWTRTFLRWADKRQVTIGFVNHLDEPPMEVWRFNLVVKKEVVKSKEVADSCHSL